MARTAKMIAPLAAFLLGLSAAGQPTRTIPTLSHAPQKPSDWQNLRGALTFAQLQSSEGELTGAAGYAGGALYVRIHTKSPAGFPSSVEVSLHFPGGIASGAHTFVVGPGGVRSGPQTDTPSFALKWVEAVSGADGTLGLRIPARAFPEFPAEGPLRLELCIYSPSTHLANCAQGSMAGGALRLPDSLHASLGLRSPPSVVAFQPAPSGWVGLDRFHHPAWVQADAPLNPASLSQLVTDQAVSPTEAQMAVPAVLEFPGVGALFSVLTGQDPFGSGACNEGQQLKLWLFRVKGTRAQRVLDWPVAKCALGRATALAMDGEDTLTIGYANGPILSFTWSDDHFERTEIGRR